MAQYNLNEIAQIVDGQLKGNGEININHLVTDSRNLISPDNSLFFAIKGERHDGHQFISDLFHYKGMKNFVVENIDEKISFKNEANFIIVPNTLDAIQKLATWHRNNFSGKVIGITGSNGKTVVKEWLYQLLHFDNKIVRSPKSYNSQIGVPLSVWNLEPSANLAIFEAGISRIDEMVKLQPIIRPDIGIFTNIGEPHQENFLSVNRKIREKLILFREVKTLIYCLDHELLAEEIDDWINPGQEKLNWSFKHDATLRITELQKTSNTSQLFGIYNGNSLQITIPFIDSASIENAIHCWLLMLFLGYSNEKIASRMLVISQVEMRLELKNGINKCILINDSYNSDFHSLEIALDFMNQQKQHIKKTLILSDILQSGKPEPELYFEVAKLLENKKVDRLLGIGSFLYANAGVFNCEKQFYLSTEEFLKQISSIDFNNETILLKGSRSFEFEKIATILEQKTHRTVLEINLTAMVHNLNYFRSKLKPTTKIMAMVKAFSYGSGSFEIANMLQFQKIDYLAVAFADEGVSLRQAGISLPIVVMNPEDESFRQMIEFNLEPEIYSINQLHNFLNILQTLQIDVYPIHIKLDTGMHRLGFEENDLPQLCKLLSQNKQVIVHSVFSHLAAADEIQHDDFTVQQIQLFSKMSQQICDLYKHKIYRHILNSAGIERFSDYQFDMVRLGIGLYGVNPFNQQKLRNVSSLKTSISQIKTVKLGETVGYGRKGKVVKPIKIATIPIGYADGLNRKFSNGIGFARLNGKNAPIIGTICMDMCMLDISEIDANEGDEVEIFGDYITITEISEKIGTIPYEILTSISPRVKRIYIQE